MHRVVFRFLPLAFVLVAACGPKRAPPEPGKPDLNVPDEVSLAYLDAWSRGDLAGAVRHVGSSQAAAFEARLRHFRSALGIVGSTFEVVETQTAGDTAWTGVRLTHQVKGLGAWSYDGQIPLERREGRWWVRASSSAIHPDFGEGDRASRTRTWSRRGELLDDSGYPLTREEERVTVGLDAGRVKDPAALAASLQSSLGIESTRTLAVLDAGLRSGNKFAPVIDLPLDVYQSTRPALAPLPGVFFRKKRARFTPWDGFASQTVGRYGEVTAELLPKLGESYAAGDWVGLSGLERMHQGVLAGRPFGEIIFTGSEGKGAARVVHAFPGLAGADVATTLRPEVQAAAEDALRDVTLPAALVAVDARTGAILAVVSRPIDQPLNRALSGRYPPGSTFKVVTTEGLLEVGVTPQTPVECPPTFVVQGKTFRNFEGESLATARFRVAFAHSCNTAFLSLASKRSSNEWHDVAVKFGFDVPYDIGLPSSGGTMPVAKDDAELAASLIGQGRVLSTPLHMASVAAAAATGVWRPPYVVPNPMGARPAETPLPANVVAPLRGLMRAVVLEGSGRQAISVDGLIGKTGTAEFGSRPPLATHAWFIGERAGVAFAIIVEGGGVGGRVAVPLAARFAGALPGATPATSPTK